MDFTKFVSISYLFNPSPGSFFTYLYPLASFFLMLILSAIAIQTYIIMRMPDQYTRVYLKKAPGMLYTFGILGLLLMWFRYENARYLSMRIWVVILLAWFVWWGVRYVLSKSAIQAGRDKDTSRDHLKRYQL